jgi:hypothetical protein
LFWKKKKTVDLEFPGEANEHRKAFRVKTDQMSPIIISLAGNSYHVMNVSGTGCCFRSHNYPVGFTAPATLKIPNEDIIFPLTILVVSRQHNICRCEFTKISEKAQNSVHAYVLKVQKQAIRND